MVINLWNACKQPCIIHLVICRNRYLPTDSADDPEKLTRKKEFFLKNNPGGVKY